MASQYLVTLEQGQAEKDVTFLDTTGMDGTQQAVQRSVAIGLARSNFLASGKRTFVYGPTEDGIPQTPDDRVWDSETDR